MARILIALYGGQGYDKPDAMLSIQESKLVEVNNIIRSANAMYDNQYLEEGTLDERIDYIMEALNGAGMDVENVFTSASSNIYL
jgi:hypothetical protein